METRIANVVENFRGQVPWQFRRGKKNMAIEPANPPEEAPRGTPAWDVFQEFVRKANQDLQALAIKVEALIRFRT